MADIRIVKQSRPFRQTSRELAMYTILVQSWLEQTIS